MLKTTYRQLQKIVTFYDIDDVDVDRYMIDGELTQVMVSARELDESNIPGGGWVTERLVYTHGFGAVLSPANDVTTQGQPDFLVKDIPPVNLSDDPSLNIDQPRIYFSDIAETDYVIAGTSQQEVDFPIGSSGADVATNSYDGRRRCEARRVLPAGRVGPALRRPRHADLGPPRFRFARC